MERSPYNNTYPESMWEYVSIDITYYLNGDLEEVINQLMRQSIDLKNPELEPEDWDGGTTIYLQGFRPKTPSEQKKFLDIRKINPNE